VNVEGIRTCSYAVELQRGDDLTSVQIYTRCVLIEISKMKNTLRCVHGKYD